MREASDDVRGALSGGRHAEEWRAPTVNRMKSADRIKFKCEARRGRKLGSLYYSTGLIGSLGGPIRARNTSNAG